MILLISEIVMAIPGMGNCGIASIIIASGSRLAFALAEVESESGATWVELFVRVEADGCA